MKKINDVTKKLHKLALLRIKNRDKINYRKYDDKHINFSIKTESENIYLGDN